MGAKGLSEGKIWYTWCVVRTVVQWKPKGSPREAQGESKESPRKYSFGKHGGGGGDGKEKFRKTE